MTEITERPGTYGDLLVFTQPRGSPVDSRIQSGLTCRLTSEPDTMGTSWPDFCHLSRFPVRCGGEDGGRAGSHKNMDDLGNGLQISLL